MLIRLRSYFFDAVWGVWTFCFLPTIPVLILLEKIRGRPLQSLVRALARKWAYGTLWLLKTIVGLDYRVIGQNNIPSTPCLMVSNHMSVWETLAYVAIIPDVALIAKKELGRIPVFGWFLKNYPMILVDRDAGGSALRHVLSESKKALKDGRSVLIFPEGTRRTAQDNIDFRRGVEGIYGLLKVQVLPMTVNAGLFWPPKSVAKLPGLITISNLPVIEAGLDPEVFREKIETAIQNERDRLIAQHSA